MKHLDNILIGRAQRIAAVLAVVAGVLGVPLISGPFWQYLVANILLLSLFALSFNLLFGMSGFLSFGHAAYYATGAYVTGLLMLAGVPLLAAVPLGAFAAAGLAVVFGFLCIRHTMVYFSLLTLALGMMVHSVVWKWSSVTGGDDGLVGIPRGNLEIPGVFSVPLNELSSYYYFLASVCLVAILVLHRISRSPFGLSLNGLRENFGRSDFVGLPPRRMMLAAFIIAGFFAGLAGALMAPLENTVTPTIAHWTKSAEPLMASLIGGPFSFFGPIVGAALFIGLKEMVVRFTNYWLLVFGFVLLVIVINFRGGIVGFINEKLIQTRRREEAS